LLSSFVEQVLKRLSARQTRSASTMR